MQINLNPTSERGASRDAVNRPGETLGDSHLISSDPRSRFGLVCDLLCCRGNNMAGNASGPLWVPSTISSPPRDTLRAMGVFEISRNEDEVDDLQPLHLSNYPKTLSSAGFYGGYTPFSDSYLQPTTNFSFS